ncbi:MAG: ATP-binding protein [Candidatus Dormiibacterota bacterium]
MPVERRGLSCAFTVRIHNELVDRGYEGTRYSSSRLATGIRTASIPAGLVLGLCAEAASYQQGSLDRNIADLVVGWVFIGSGLLTWQQRPHSRLGPLLWLTGVAWFLGSVATVMLFLHRGPLLHAMFAYPSGRISGWFRRGVVVVGYAEAAIQPLGGNPVATLVLGTLVASAAVYGYSSDIGPRRRAGAVANGAALLFALVLALGSLARLTAHTFDAAALWAYQGVLVVIALGLLSDLLRGRWSQGAVTGLVVDLGGLWERSSLQDKLARALGDTSLTLGYSVDGDTGYVDEAGRPITVPAADDVRAVTRIESNHQPLAVLVHDRSVLEDGTLIDAVAAAARMAVDTVRLEAEVHSHVAELEASRRRIVEASGNQRRRLERELHQGAETRLAAVSRHIGMLRHGVSDAHAMELLGEVEQQLTSARHELRELARGLHPAALTTGGLSTALLELVKRSPFDVEVRIDAGRWPEAVETAAYYVCSEALTNVAKYARASRVRIDIEDRGARLAVTIVDNGVGGAHQSQGSGLRGLSDRVEALGGWFSVESPPGGGTRLVAEMPTM